MLRSIPDTTEGMTGYRLRRVKVRNQKGCAFSKQAAKIIPRFIADGKAAQLKERIEAYPLRD